MRAGIGDRIVHEIMRQVWIVRMTIESKLEHAHPGQTKLVAQGMHVGSNQPQIFRDEW